MSNFHVCVCFKCFVFTPVLSAGLMASECPKCGSVQTEWTHCKAADRQRACEIVYDNFHNKMERLVELIANARFATLP
jgi:hypothetical protein